jgi:hypothetical protein
MQIPPGLIVLIGIWFLPYSPRWLITQGREREAHAALKQLMGEDEEFEGRTILLYLSHTAETIICSRIYPHEGANQARKGQRSQVYIRALETIPSACVSFCCGTVVYEFIWCECDGYV